MKARRPVLRIGIIFKLLIIVAIKQRAIMSPETARSSGYNQRALQMEAGSQEVQGGEGSPRGRLATSPASSADLPPRLFLYVWGG